MSTPATLANVSFMQVHRVLDSYRYLIRNFPTTQVASTPLLFIIVSCLLTTKCLLLLMGHASVQGQDDMWPHG